MMTKIKDVMTKVSKYKQLNICCDQIRSICIISGYNYIEIELYNLDLN
jgi:hypothetical protein